MQENNSGNNSSSTQKKPLQDYYLNYNDDNDNQNEVDYSRRKKL